MKILDRYLVKNFLPPFLYCLTLFLSLYVIVDLFGHLDEILKNAVSLKILLNYYISMMPFIILNTTPVAVLIATMYSLGNLQRFDEITAMRAAGISVLRIISPYIILGLIISMSVLIVSEKILPNSMKKAQNLKETYIETKNDAESPKVVDNIALIGKDNRLIFIETLDINKNTIESMTILKQDEEGNVQEKITSQKGKWTGKDWLFFNVIIYNLDKKGALIGNPNFYKTLPFTLESPKRLISKGTAYEFMSYTELSDYIKNFKSSSKSLIKRLEVDLHQKLSMPFTSLVIMLIGASFVIKTKKRGKSLAVLGMGVSIIIGFLYYALIATFTALGKGGILPPLLSAHLANIIFFLTGIIYLKF